jgi:threonine/homoserine/homoserine lactone efflux protein
MEFLFVGLMGCYMFSRPLSFILVIGFFNCTEITSNNNNRSGLRGPFFSGRICVLASPKTHGFFCVIICVFLDSQQPCASFS